MHPRIRCAPLKPQVNRLDPRQRLARGVLGAWLINDDGGLRAIGAGTTENYPPKVRDAGPYDCDVSIEATSDEARTVESPWGLALWGGTGTYNTIRNDWGKFWGGLTAVSTFAIVRNQVASQRSNILCVGLSGTTTTKLEFEFTSGNNLWYKTRAGTEGAQGKVSTKTFSANKWHVIGASARVVNGGGIYHLYEDGYEIASTGTPNHSFDSYNNAYGSWNCRLGGLDYGQNTWAKIDVAFAMHWGWELTPEDFASLADDPFQAFHAPEVTRYADVFLGGPSVSYYIVKLPRNLGAQRIEGISSMTIDAASEAIAKNMAAARFEGDSDWTQAEATLLAPLVTGTYNGTKFRVKITGKPIPSPDLIDVSYTADSDDNLGDVASGIVAAINATKEITSANWNTPNIVIPGSEGLGDRRVIVEITPPGAKTPITWTDGLPVKSITDEGSSGDDLKIEMADTGIPRILG